MRSLSFLFFWVFLALTQECGAQSYPHTEGYSWVTAQKIALVIKGQIPEKGRWLAPNRLKGSADSFVVYENFDSIRMTAPDDRTGKLFKRTEKKFGKRKPLPNYGNELFLLGTYERDDLREMHASIYASKDWSSLLQLHYLNTGQLLFVLLYSQTKVNVLKKDKVLVDPKD